MMDILVRLEETGFATWVRESSSLLAYPSILFLHTLGMGCLAGLSAFIDLRILGFGQEVPLESMEKFFPYMWAGFWLNTATGIALFIPDATVKSVNPVFYVKLAFIAIAVLIMRRIKSKIFRDPLVGKRPIEMDGKILAVASIICWIAAITAGRLLAYIGPGTAAAQGG